MSFLPIRDREYLKNKECEYIEVETPKGRGVRIKNWDLSNLGFDYKSTEVLILIPDGYADVAPDMFYTYPWLKLTQTNQHPKAADHKHEFDGVSWQRWSRHSKEWRPGVDGISTMFQRVRSAFENAK